VKSLALPAHQFLTALQATLLFILQMNQEKTAVLRKK
jgi:hypothetical protein